MAGTMFKWDLPSRFDDKLEAKRAADLFERQENAKIDRRDHRSCRACGKATNPEAIGVLERGHRAHIIYASAGGTMDASNRVTLCPRCHNDEHRDRLRFARDGGPYVGIDANAPMEFWRKDDLGEWFVSRREISVGRVERD